RLVLQYHRDAFDQDTAEGLAARFRSILRQLATDPGRRLAAVDLLLPGENSPGEQPIPTVEATLSALVARRAVANPAAVAVTTAGRSLTYWELDALADRLARRLAGEGAGAGAVVGIVLPRSVDLVVALLGTLRSGAAHVLVDPARGTPWRDHVLAAADVALTAVRLDGPDPGNAPPPPAPHDLACLRFPPPADLQPAALAVDHRALRDGVLRLAAAAGLEPGTRLLAASPHEDTVALEILAALSAGATVELVEDLGRGWTGDVVSSAAPLLDPGIIRAITVVCTGDPPPESFVRRVREALPGVRLVDAYGTGTPVGAPIAGMRAHVLSPALRPLPPGVPGELYVAGEVAREHAGHAAARFVADPFGPPGARLYRTGEHVRWTREGRLEHVGRGASLTVGGHRVWPGEVEAVLAEHPAVAWAAVTTGDRLVGHVVPLGTSVDTEELREFAARRLPNHLVPASFVLAEKLPLAADGSIDRAALDDTAAGGGPAEHRPGRTPQEVALCELVAEILGIERVGIDDNLFSLGVNSLMAGRLVSRMRRTLGMEVSIRTVFRSATIANLSGQVTIATTERKARPRLRRMTPE
ncbi:MAG TPA: AMP-binding protein, partial [Actinophytocola sp.]|nr:AMP-binding protein [Actinophytocola sp.]